MLLQGTVTLVTGAGQGLGQGIARAVAEEGAQVVVTDVCRAHAERSASDIEHALPLSLDVTDAKSIEAAIQRTVDVFGRLDGWVNNAGVVEMEHALAVTDHSWSRHFEVNVSGLFACCQAFARYASAASRRQSHAAIVNLASNAGKVGYPNMAAYNATKAAVINLTRSLAAEWAPYNINVNAVCPGGVDTPMLWSVAEWIAGRTGGDATSIHRSMTPHQLGRHIQPVEVGRIVAFLLSERAQIIRGQSINVDGGDTPY